MQQIFGNFLDVLPTESSTLEVNFVSHSPQIKKSWGNIRLSAHFIAEYFSNTLLLNQDDPDLREHIESVKSTVLYICNELLENAVKFSEKAEDYQLKLGIHFLENSEKSSAVIFTKNRINEQTLQRLQELIQKLLSSDLNKLYVQQIETASADENSGASGLGLLTIMNDHSASLGWKFTPEPNNPKIYTVTTMAQLTV